MDDTLSNSHSPNSIRSELQPSPEFDPKYRRHRPSFLTVLLLGAVIAFIWWMIFS